MLGGTISSPLVPPTIMTQEIAQLQATIAILQTTNAKLEAQIETLPLEGLELFALRWRVPVRYELLMSKVRFAWNDLKVTAKPSNSRLQISTRVDCYARTHVMMLHSEFCAVWLSLSDVTGKKNFAH